MSTARKPLESEAAVPSPDVSAPDDHTRGFNEPRLFLGIGYGLMLALLLWVVMTVALVLWLRS